MGICDSFSIFSSNNLTVWLVEGGTQDIISKSDTTLYVMFTLVYCVSGVGLRKTTDFP